MLWVMALPPTSGHPDAPPPSALDDITASWLSATTGQVIERVTIEALGAGVGLLGAVARVWVDPPVSITPGEDTDRVIVKLPSTDPGVRRIVEHFGYGHREAGTYRHLLPRRGVAAPRCLAVVEGADGPAFVLEDLGRLRPGDQLAGASPRDALAVARMAGRLHGAFWNEPILATQAWLPSPADAVIADYGRLFALMWPMYTAGAGALIDPALLATAEMAIEHFDRVIMSFSDGPHTLVHGDLRLDNVLFEDHSPGPSDPTAVAMDWQLAARGRGPYDLAFFAAGSLEPDVRRLIEPALLAAYHRELIAAGVRDYAPDDVERDYRRGLVMNLPNPITAIVAVAGGNARGDALLAANARRAMVAVADHLMFLS
jgi:hypothetical protein